MFSPWRPEKVKLNNCTKRAGVLGSICASVLCSSSAYADPVSVVVGGVGVELIRQSHIAGNVPAGDAEFNRMLCRDLDTYFSAIKKKKVNAHFELLRKLPTQVGVAYPKFYAWVKLCDPKSGAVFEQGVVRVAAVEKTQFDVTHYLTASEICKNPASVGEIIPASLCAGVVDRAKSSQKAP